MRKILIFSILTIAALSLIATVVFAGEGKCTRLSTVSSVNISASCDGSDGPVKAAALDDSKWAVRTISVKGMTCTGCEESITAELVKVPGVMEVVSVSHKSGEAIVKIDPEKAQEPQLTKAITDKGYQAEIIPAVAQTTGDSKGPVCPMSGGPGCEAMKAAGGDCQKVHSARDAKADDKSKEKSDDIH